MKKDIEDYLFRAENEHTKIWNERALLYNNKQYEINREGIQRINDLTTQINRLEGKIEGLKFAINNY